MFEMVLILTIIVMAFFFLVVYRKNKNNTEKTKHFIMLFVFFCIALYCFVILMYQPPFSFFLDKFPELYSDGAGTWVDIWLNIFSITISTITALIAIRISKQQKSMEDFSFYSNLEFVPFSDSFSVEEINDNIKLTQLKSVAELPNFPSQANKLYFNLTNPLNPEIKYNLVSVKIIRNSGVTRTETFETEKKEIIFEHYTLDNRTSLEITLLTYNDEHYNLFIPLIGKSTYTPFYEKYKYEIIFDFKLESINDYDFVNNKKYQITMTLMGKEIRSDDPNEPLQHKFLITKSNSEIV